MRIQLHVFAGPPSDKIMKVNIDAITNISKYRRQRFDLVEQNLIIDSKQGCSGFIDLS